MAEYSTLARPYAKAAFEHAVANGALESWSEALAWLAQLVEDAQLSALLRSPAISRAQRADLLIELGGGRLPAPVRNFVQVLASNDRLLLLPVILEQFQALKADHERLVEVEVTSAAPSTKVSSSGWRRHWSSASGARCASRCRSTRR